MSMKPFVKSHHVALFNRKLDQTGEIDQPERYTLFSSEGPQISPSVKFYLPKGVGVYFAQPLKERLAYKSR